MSELIEVLKFKIENFKEIEKWVREHRQNLEAELRDLVHSAAITG